MMAAYLNHSSMNHMVSTAPFNNEIQLMFL
jgi:hypothetical protein